MLYTEAVEAMNAKAVKATNAEAMEATNAKTAEAADMELDTDDKIKNWKILNSTP